MPALLSKQRIIARPDFNRWRIVPAALGIHLCIGSVYAWSIFNPALTKHLGVVVSAADDWTLREVVWIFTVAIVFLGLAAATVGNWLDRVGPRLIGVISACCLGAGFLIGALGIATHQVWLLYLGYGVVGGCGLGLGYVSPVSTLIRWFPDRRGMATGLAIMGFGGGALIAAPLKEMLLRVYYQAPEFLGPVADVELITQMGRRFVEVAGELKEVVVVGANNLAGMTVPGPEGVYLVGTGSAGITQTFITLGLGYFVIMLISAFAYRVPPDGWLPAGWSPPVAKAVGDDHMMIRRHVDLDQVLKTRQFYQLWIILCLNVTAGIGVLGVAKTMITEIFGAALPTLVDGAFAATYVVMISVFNMAGRVVWASVSDYIGRRNVYWIFFALGILLYCSIPFAAQSVSVSPTVIWLVYFYGVTMLIFTMYGGGFATIPAYLADIFGTRFVGGIHGRLLTAWSVAGVIGPLAITSLRERSVTTAIEDLAAKIDPAVFQATFGASVDQLAALTEAKNVTIARLMEIAPIGTVDPTPNVYNTTMYLMAALLAVALVSNALMGPVNPKRICPIVD